LVIPYHYFSWFLVFGNVLPGVAVLLELDQVPKAFGWYQHSASGPQ